MASQDGIVVLEEKDRACVADPTESLQEPPPLPPTGPAETAVADDVRLASAAARLAAFAVDLLLLALADIFIGALAALAVGLASVTTQTFFVDGRQAIEQFTVIGSVFFAFFYFTGMHAGSGQTLGKAFFDIEVERRDGTRLDWPHSLLRTCAELLTLLTLGLGFLGAARPAGRALHDSLADTRVVRSHGGLG
jgi:uncharacterized RDD family membrane protein YckC